MRKCPVCKKSLKPDQYYCSENCADIADGEGPRKSPGFEFGCDSPDKIESPGGDYRSNEEIRVYGDR